MERKKRALRSLVFVAFLFAIAGQYYFIHKRDYLWDGVALYALAVVLFGRALALWRGGARRKKRAFGQALWQLLGKDPWRLGFLVLGLALSVYVAFVAEARSRARPFWDLFILWGVGIAFVLGAWLDWKSLWRRLTRLFWQPPSPEGVLVVLLVLIAFLFRGTHLGSIPYVLSGDEASMGLEAVSVLKGQRHNPFVTGWLSHPTLYFFLLAAFLRVLGITTAALRLASAMISSLTVALLYLFVRRAYGRWLAVISAIFFVSYHYAIHFGRLAINNIWDPFFALGVFYFLHRGVEEDRLGDFLAAGLMLGLAVYFYMGARLIPLLLIGYLGYWLLRERQKIWQSAPSLLVMGLVAFTVALPLLVFFLHHPNDMMARWRWVGIFPSGWVQQEVQRTGKTVWQVLWGQFLKAALAFNYYPDPTFWYHPGKPLLCFFSSIFFVFGLVDATYHWRKRENVLLLLWFWAVIIFGGMLLENPPTSPRLVLAIPPVVIFVAMGIVRVAQLLQLALNKGRWMAVVLSLCLVLFVSYQSVHFYFAKYTPSHVFAGLNTEVADRMGRYLRALGPEYRCYFFGAPRMYYSFATIPFLAQGVEGMDVVEPLKQEPDFVQSDRVPVFIFLPERKGELAYVRRVYPSGLLREFRNERGQLLFISYEAGG